MTTSDRVGIPHKKEKCIHGKDFCCECAYGVYREYTKEKDSVDDMNKSTRQKLKEE